MRNINERRDTLNVLGLLMFLSEYKFVNIYVNVGELCACLIIAYIANDDKIRKHVIDAE